MSDQDEQVSDQTSEEIPESVANPGVSWEWEVEQNRLKGIEPEPDFEEGETEEDKQLQDNQNPLSFVPVTNEESTDEIDLSSNTEGAETINNDSEEEKNNNA